MRSKTLAMVSVTVSMIAKAQYSKVVVMGALDEQQSHEPPGSDLMSRTDVTGQEVENLPRRGF